MKILRILIMLMVAMGSLAAGQIFAAATTFNVLDCGAKLVRPEIGPEGLREDELGVGRLPQKEIRDAQLA